MSIEAIQRVADYSRLTGMARHALVWLAYHENAETGLCCPSMTTLARELAVTPRHVRKLVRACEDAGELKVERGGGRRGDHGIPSRYHILPNSYTVQTDRVRDGSTRSNGTGYSSTLPGHLGHPTRSSGAPYPVTPGTLPGPPGPPNRIEPNENPKSTTKGGGGGGFPSSMGSGGGSGDEDHTKAVVDALIAAGVMSRQARQRIAQYAAMSPEVVRAAQARIDGDGGPGVLVSILDDDASRAALVERVERQAAESEARAEALAEGESRKRRRAQERSARQAEEQAGRQEAEARVEALLAEIEAMSTSGQQAVAEHLIGRAPAFRRGELTQLDPVDLARMRTMRPHLREAVEAAQEAKT